MKGALHNILEGWEQITQQWTAKNIILFLDYDGTLAPIAPSPSEAVLPQENKELICRLAQDEICEVVLISGRSLGDLKQMVGIQGIAYIGNHGWEIEGPHIKFTSLLPVSVSSTMEEIKYALEAKLSAFEGVLVEDKKITLSVHFRLLNEQDYSSFKKILDEVCLPYIRHKRIKMMSGKKVFELRPPLEWDKGKAVLWFLKRHELVCGSSNILPVYLGDDTTDEDAFKALEHKGITVFVGGRKSLSKARYYVESVGEVTEFLRRLSALAKERPQVV